MPWACASGVTRVQLSPWLSPRAVLPSQYSPPQGKELAVTVERHISQVEDLQPCEVAHVGDVAHFVALQVKASDLGTEASEGTGGNLQRREGGSGGPDGSRGANLSPCTANQTEGPRGPVLNLVTP